jgi:hypothetical protein
MNACHSGKIMADRRRGAMADIDQVVNDLSACARSYQLALRN